MIISKYIVIIYYNSEICRLLILEYNIVIIVYFVVISNYVYTIV